MLLCFVWLASCSDEGSTGFDYDASRTAVDQFVNSAQAQRFVLIEKEHSLGECLRLKGWSYVDQDVRYYSPTLEPNYSPMLAASTVGFGIFTSFTIGSGDAPPIFELGLSDGERVAFLQDLEGSNGCKEQVNNEWKKRDSVLDGLARAYAEEVAAKIEISAEISDATLQWSRCMVESSGRKFEAPSDVIQFLLKKKGELGKSDEWALIEIGLAKNNVNCAEPLLREQARQEKILEPGFVQRHGENLRFLKDNLYGGGVPT